MRIKLLWAFLFVAGSLFAQNRVCTASLPINVISKDGRIVNTLPTNALLSRSKKVEVLTDLTNDNSSRRILLVFDLSRDLRKEVLESEHLMARSIIDHARPEDRFAVITGNGVIVKSPFSDGNEDASKAVEQVFASRTRDDPTKLMTSLGEGIRWFEERQTGDAVVLFAAHTFDPNRDDGAAIQTTLLTKNIRLFGVSLGPVEAGSVANFFIYGHPTAGYSSLYNVSPSNILALSLTSGGYGYVHNEMDDPRTTFRLTDEKKAVLLRESSLIYGTVVYMYKQSVRYKEPKKTQLELGISDEILKRFPAILPLYPHILLGCSDDSNNN
jgi:hypothetical protein